MHIMRVFQMWIKENEKCKYFPCHDLAAEEFDCRTCYCPLYEICSEKQNPIFGGYLLKNTIWACEKCSFIHKKIVVEELIELEKQGLTKEEIYNKLLSKKRSKK